MKNFLKYNWPSILWAAFILVICLMPAHHIPRIRIPNFDKIVHTSVYMIFAVLTYYGWSMQSSIEGLHQKTLLKIIIVLALYGLSVEIMQETLTTDRHFEWLDEVANSSGAVIGAYIGRWILPRLKT